MSIKLGIFKAYEHEKPIKCTIQKTGKLGFSEGAINFLGISEERNRNIYLAHNTEDKNDLNLYAFLTSEENPEAFKINKAGNYYYVNTKTLFDTMGLEYEIKYITFDISPIEIEGKKIYKLTRRVKERFGEETEKGGTD